MYNEKEREDFFTAFICKEAEKAEGDIYGSRSDFRASNITECVLDAQNLEKNKNMLGIAFSAATLLVFGWFTIMTVLNNGYPPAH
ncbi:hypothetical protein GCM10020331_039640 [Ectobacillus funiculus]